MAPSLRYGTENWVVAKRMEGIKAHNPTKGAVQFSPIPDGCVALGHGRCKPGGERRCWRMCRYVFPQVFPPWQSCTRTADLAGVMQSCLSLQLSRGLPWHFAQLWAPGAVVGKRALPKKLWVYLCSSVRAQRAMQRSPSDPLPHWENGIIHPPLTSPN